MSSPGQGTSTTTRLKSSIQKVEVIPFGKEREKLSTPVCPRLWLKTRLATYLLNAWLCLSLSLRGGCSTSFHWGAGSSLPGLYRTANPPGCGDINLPRLRHNLSLAVFSSKVCHQQYTLLLFYLFLWLPRNCFSHLSLQCLCFWTRLI